MNNPILSRELRSMLRSRMAGGLGIAYVIILAAMIWVLWPAEGVFSLAAQTSRAMVLTFTVVQLLLVILYAPAFSATSIVSEKESECFDLLFASLLRPWQILVGKLFSSILLLVGFVFLSLPFFAACFFLGAVSPQEAARLYSVVLATSVLTGLLGLSVSSRAKDSHSALITTYLLLILLCSAPWLPHLVFGSHAVLAGPAAAVRAISPLTAVASILLPGFDVTSSGLNEPVQAWRLYLHFAAIVSMLLIFYLIGSIYWRIGYQKAPNSRVIDDTRELVRRKLRFPFYLIDPQRRKRNLSNWINPVFAREMRSQAFGGGMWIFRGIYLCLAGSMFLMVLLIAQMGHLHADTVKVAALAFQLGLVILLTPSLTASAVTRELECKSLDGLRMSRVRPASFLLGKLELAVMFVLFLVVGSAPLWLVIVKMDMNTPREIGISWAVIGSTILLCLTAGLCCSAFARRTSTAAATAYGLVFLIAIGTLFPFLAPGKFSPAWHEALIGLNPLIVVMYVLRSDQVGFVPVLWRQHLIFSLSLSGIMFLLAALRTRFLFQPQR